MGNPGEDQKFRGGGNVTRSHAYVKFVACFESDILFLRLGGKLVKNVTLTVIFSVSRERIDTRKTLKLGETRYEMELSDPVVSARISGAFVIGGKKN